MTEKQREIDGRIVMAIQLVEELERTLRILLETTMALRKIQLEISQINDAD